MLAARILASPAFTNKKVNPYNALLYGEINNLAPVVEEYSHRKALLERYDILHFHWPDGYINEPGLLKALQRIVVFSLIILTAKLKHTRIVWTVHNIVPHDSCHPHLSRRFMRWFVNRCDGFIFMSEQGKKDFFAHYQPREKAITAIIPHGHYRNSYLESQAKNPAQPDTIGLDAAKRHAQKQLGLPPDKTVILSFGMIKAYKNIDRLLESFKAANLDDYVLLVAGNPEPKHLARELQVIAGEHPGIKLAMQFIPDDAVSVYHCAADIVVLPYKHILNSGALLLALSFNKPVIAPHIGAFVTLQQELGPQWVYTYEGELNGAVLQAALQAVAQSQRPAVCPLDNYNWDHLAQLTLNFYQQVTQAS